MKIGIDISQIVYEGTGVARHVRHLVSECISQDHENEYILFGASMRKMDVLRSYIDEMKEKNPRVSGRLFMIPPTLLDFLWNIIHIAPIQWFIGGVDIFWSSDWTQPPLGDTYGVTTIHDLSFLRYPEHFDRKILSVQKRRLKNARKECSMFFCDSESTKKDVIEYYTIPKDSLAVVYPGGIW